MSADLPLPLGFRTAGLHCGVKPDPTVFDLAVFASDAPCTAAGVFTTNLVCGAPVKVSRERVPRATARGVVINSGNSNACTGERGLEDARWMTAQLARGLGCAAEDVLVCSTGVIGRFLPRAALESGIAAAVPRLSAEPHAFRDAARGIMTTDTFPKQAVRETTVAGRTVRVAGTCKGAAMIAPNMATMLSVVMTDAPLSPAQADSLLRHAVDRSFNCISVEGHRSTSDTVILLASGAAGTGPLDEAGLAAVGRMLDETTAELAQMIVRDGEGASHFVTIDVRGTRTRDEAVRIARSVADSPLCMTAITGGDPNWGRFVSACGYAGVALREEDITLHINGMLLYEKGTPVAHDPQVVSKSILASRDTSVELDLTLGDAACRFWTCDLTAEYIRLNAEYTT